MIKKNTKSKTHLIITGGTIDSYYNGIKDTVEPLKKTFLIDYLKSLKLYESFVITEVCMKDSRSLNKHDLANVLSAIESSKCKRIIITHGTYTMPDTARYIKANLKRADQAIILTGSMIPLQGFAPSDAGFNLGYSIAASDFVEPGIYVSMNGKLFSPEEVVKQLSKGRFVSVFNK